MVEIDLTHTADGIYMFEWCDIDRCEPGHYWMTDGIFTVNQACPEGAWFRVRYIVVE